MSVHQLDDGRWVVHYPKGKNPQEPNRTREYFGRGPDGERAARERNSELGLGTKRKETSPEFGKLAEQYMAAKQPGMSRASYTSMEAKINNVILPVLGEYRAMEITPEILDGYVAHRAKKVKHTTIHRDLSDIRAILRWAAKRRYIVGNPIEGYEFPRRDDAVIMPPTVKEVQAILANAPAHLYRAILLAYYTGVRPGAVELYNLKWHDVDLFGNNIHVTSARKGGLNHRDIPIMDRDFKKLLKRWLKEDQKAKKKLDDYIITYKGKRVASLKRSWQKAKEKANITRRMRMYDLRHSFATKLLDNAADLKHVSLLLGHKSVQQTVDTYQHTSKKLSSEAVKKLPSVLKK